MTVDASGSGPRDPVEVLLEEYLVARRRGSAPDLDLHVERAGDRAAELRELIESAEMLEELKGTRPRGLALHAPQVFGDYRIVAEIGRGGMGVVYEAEQITLGRRVAIKVLPPQALRSESRLLRFKREAQTAAKLHHTNIVPVFGVGEQDGVHYYVMQLIVGRSLDEVVRALRGEKATRSDSERRPRSGSMALSAESAAEALRKGAHAPPAPGRTEIGPGDAAYYRSVATLGLQVADALTYAHAQGTLHRDMKPGNLILDAHGVVWVTDFGLAKVIEEETFTHSGDVVGTLQYMAPEQFGGHADERTDVHGLGLVLYELATLQQAFASDSRGDLIDRVKNQEPAPAGRVRPGVPRDLETIIRKATAKDPSHRYATAADVRDDLERFLHDRPIRARPVSALESGWRWCRRNRLLASVGAVAVLGLVSTAVVGVVGYVSTGRALGQAVRETERAEANVARALTALENVFALVVGPDMLRAEDDEESEVVAPEVGAGLTAADQAILAELLRGYDQLAASNRGNAAARQLAARAYHRVGEIHLQLERSAEAIANYERSVGMYAQLVADGVVGLGTLMQAENGLCRALIHGFQRVGRGRGWSGSEGERERDGAMRALDLAKSTLERSAGASGAPTPLMRFECARAHQFLAHWSWLGPLREASRRGSERGRRGMSFEARQDLMRQTLRHHEAALRLLEALVAEDPSNVAYRHETARECLAMAQGTLRSGRTAEATKLQARAVELLEGLVAEQPRRSQYRADLVTVLQLQPPSAWGRGGRRAPWGESLAADAQQIAWHRRAVEQARSLHAEFPGTPEFARSLGDVALKTASMLLVEDPDEAGTLARLAVEVLRGEEAWRLYDAASSAAGILLGSDPAAAREMAQLALATAERAASEREDGRRAPSLTRARRRLFQTLWRGGATGEALERLRDALAQYEAGDRWLDSIDLRATAAEEFVRSGDGEGARRELARAEEILHRVEVSVEESHAAHPSPVPELVNAGQQIASAYEALAALDSASEDLRTEVRTKVEALRHRYPDRREPPRRN